MSGNIRNQVGSLLTDLAWNLYLIFPLYLVYKGCRIVWGWLQNPQKYVEDNAQGKSKKKAEKKEKIKYIK